MPVEQVAPACKQMVDGDQEGECLGSGFGADATIRCFALVRTISPGEVSALLVPTPGTITYREGRLRRQPSRLLAPRRR